MVDREEVCAGIIVDREEVCARIIGGQGRGVC